eukprot:scaffold7768_cov277-Pinguiococcus_pyrenoidosus.AAC.4
MQTSFPGERRTSEEWARTLQCLNDHGNMRADPSYPGRKGRWGPWLWPGAGTPSRSRAWQLLASLDPGP